MFSKNYRPIFAAGTACLAAVFCFFGCNKDVIEKQAAEIESLTTKVDSLVQIVNIQNAEITSFKETDQGFFTEGLKQMKSGNLEQARTTFNELADRFPNSNLVPKAKMHIATLSAKIALSQISGIKSSLSASDKSTYVSASEQLSALLSQNIGQSARGKASVLLSDVKNMLSSWTITIADVKTLENRFSDLRGKKVIIPRATLELDDYYNYNFRNDNYWRSFELTTGGYDDINAYARKGGKLAEELVDKASSGLSIRNVVVRYPYNCEDNGVIELLSCDY